MYENVGTRVSEDVVKDIEYVAKEEKSDKSKVVRELLTIAIRQRLVELALEKYFRREVSLGRAAELAKLSLADFMKILSERKVPINYSLKSLEEDFKAAIKAK